MSRLTSHSLSKRTYRLCGLWYIDLVHKQHIFHTCGNKREKHILDQYQVPRFQYSRWFDIRLKVDFQINFTTNTSLRDIINANNPNISISWNSRPYLHKYRFQDYNPLFQWRSLDIQSQWSFLPKLPTNCWVHCTYNI